MERLPAFFLVQSVVDETVTAYFQIKEGFKFVVKQVECHFGVLSAVDIDVIWSTSVLIQRFLSEGLAPANYDESYVTSFFLYNGLDNPAGVNTIRQLYQMPIIHDVLDEEVSTGLIGVTLESSGLSDAITADVYIRGEYSALSELELVQSLMKVG